MHEIIKTTLRTLESYGADDEDMLFLFYNCIGLIPLCIYWFKYNNKRYTVLTNIGIHILRVLIFSVSFSVLIRFGFTEEWIKWNSLLIITYTIIGYYYWVHEELLSSLTNRMRHILKYIFYTSISIQSIYILCKLLEV